MKQARCHVQQRVYIKLTKRRSEIHGTICRTIRAAAKLRSEAEIGSAKDEAELFPTDPRLPFLTPQATMVSATDLFIILVVAAAGAYWLFLRTAGSKAETLVPNGSAKAGSSESTGNSRDFAAAMKKAVSVVLQLHGLRTGSGGGAAAGIPRALRYDAGYLVTKTCASLAEAVEKILSLNCSENRT
jgi:hypothetical protein